ncbi:MAG TPA: phosphoenolpyruvate--protein phosphotransferase [Myxococcota bacterium]|nr:phosphoenolpyruvate--protein phosphotransferase [Myxococcota bacterium]
MHETLGNVVDLVGKRLGADACSIYLVEADLTRLTLSATNGLNREAIGRVQMPLGEGLVGLAALRRQPVVSDDAQNHPHYKYFPETGEERFTTLVAVPLLMRGVTIGVLVIQTVERRTFDSHDIDLFQTCAQLISPIVMNARLLSLVDLSEEEIQSSNAELASHGIRVAGGPRPRAEHNVEFRGIGTSRGIAIGTVYRMENPLDLAVLEYTPRPSADAEESDLLQAIQLVRRDLDDNREELGDRFGPDFSAVFHTHIQILEDKGFVAKLRKAVHETGNARNALVEVLSAYRKTFGRIEDAYFRDRMMDVEDVGRRVMEQLLGDRHVRPTLERGSIVVTDNLLPGHFARLDLDRIAAIVSEHGGPTSHGAIFARTLEIPAVTGVPGLSAAIRPGELAVVDGGEGTVFLSPDDRLVTEYQRARERFEIAAEHLDALRALPAETRDGRRIALTANCGLVSDLRLVEQHGAEGVGLFRTEMLAVAHRGFPEEEEQEQLYERVATLLAPRPVTIRTLDLGGDKEVTNLALPHEENPQLGCRSIRLSFTHLEAFRAQLRAILRASAGGNVRLLLPMISSLEELRRARGILEETKDGMRSAGVAFDPDLPVGIMIEVPSAALIADTLARECDFFSIGTNDLTQYTLAVDRGNEHIAHLFDPLHPAVLGLIDRSVRGAMRAGIPVSVCGEMASNPLAVPILVGLGIGELSATPSAVPIVKEIVHALDQRDAEADARRAREAGTAKEVRAIGAERLLRVGLLEHPDIGPWLRLIVEAELEPAGAHSPQQPRSQRSPAP